MREQERVLGVSISFVDEAHTSLEKPIAAKDPIEREYSLVWDVERWNPITHGRRKEDIPARISVRGRRRLENQRGYHQAHADAQPLWGSFGTRLAPLLSLDLFAKATPIE